MVDFPHLAEDKVVQALVLAETDLPVGCGVWREETANRVLRVGVLPPAHVTDALEVSLRFADVRVKGRVIGRDLYLFEVEAPQVMDAGADRFRLVALVDVGHVPRGFYGCA